MLFSFQSFCGVVVKLFKCTDPYRLPSVTEWALLKNSRGRVVNLSTVEVGQAWRIGC